ncbi:hypothetical protein WN944_022298 [Citrus x changshan-huyou]|uniref:Uncharacterized protein n=1 Tax=Citrus x changshan-huyou TaxID=2935761 RepID=A0AAP0R347_9ROSI
MAHNMFAKLPQRVYYPSQISTTTPGRPPSAAPAIKHELKVYWMDLAIAQATKAVCDEPSKLACRPSDVRRCPGDGTHRL